MTFKLNTLYTGYDFNKEIIKAGLSLFKFTNKSLNHHGYQFDIGYNEDIHLFNNTKECGFHFCDERYLGRWINYSDCSGFHFIVIPNDALVYIEHGRYRADKIILGKKRDITLNMLLERPNMFRYIEKQTIEMCEKIVEVNGLMLKHIKEQTEKICKNAVKQNGISLRYVNNKYKTDEICEMAVINNCYSLDYVLVKTPYLCKIALTQNGLLLEGIIKLQFDKHIMNELIIIAIKQNGLALRFVKNQTYEFCKLAILQNGFAYTYINKEYAVEELKKLSEDKIEEGITNYKNKKEYTQTYETLIL